MNTEHTEKPHIVPLSTYFSVAITLYILTAVTVMVAMVNLGGWNVAVALSIAAIKGSLVALIFMHLKYEKKILAVVFVGAIVFLAIFIIFTMFDTMTRGELDPETARPIKSKAAMYDNPTAVNEHGETATDSLTAPKDSAATEQIPNH